MQLLRLRCWLIQRVYQSASSPHSTEASLQLREEERGVTLSCGRAWECTENKSQVPQEVLPSSDHERGVSCLYSTAFPYYFTIIFFSPIFFVATCWGVIFSLPCHELDISSNPILPSLANKLRSWVYPSELAAFWYSWSPFSFSTSKSYKS